MICECLKCGHVWNSRVNRPLPKECPKCQSVNWNNLIEKNQYNFGAIEVGGSMLYPWKDESERQNNYKINAALTAFCHRTKRTFKRIASGRGLEITRLT